jgi:hypothetical protein
MHFLRVRREHEHVCAKQAVQKIGNGPFGDDGWEISRASFSPLNPIFVTVGRPRGVR